MAYINAEEVRSIRNALKAEFGKALKFSVSKGSGSYSVNVNIMEGNIDFSDVLGDRESMDLNHHWLENYPKHQKVLEKIMSITKTAPAKAGVGGEWFDESDAMTDYFHTAYYIHLGLGKWNKPYVKRSA